MQKERFCFVYFSVFYVSLFFFIFNPMSPFFRFPSRANCEIQSFKEVFKNVIFQQGTQNTIGSTLFCFPKSKQIICLLEGWIRQKTIKKCKQMYFIPQMIQLIFGGLNKNNKQCSTFTFMYLVFQHVSFSTLALSQVFDHLPLNGLSFDPCCSITLKALKYPTETFF